MRIGEILVRQGRVTVRQIEDALARQRETAPRHRLGEVLRASGEISEDDILRALAAQFGLDFLNAIDESLLAPDLVREIPVDWVRERTILPVRWRNGVALVTDDPGQTDAFSDISLMLGCEAATLLAPRAAILAAIEHCYVNRQSAPAAAAQAAGGHEGARAGDDLLRTSSQAPVAKAVNAILLEAVRRGASDVHIEPFHDRLRLRYRIDGFLYEQPEPAKQLEAGLISRLKVMAKLDIAEKRLPQDGMVKVRVGEREIDIRVSTVPVAEGERVVLRLLNQDSTNLPLTSLGMPEPLLNAFRALLAEPNGIVLVTGPTGSGKTTTLYAGLRELDTAHRNVMTIEDPIEYQLPDIGQIQVHPKIGLTFASGLRHILRQDPDVVFVGEIRDQETAEISIRASLTGHLVFSTLHTNDAPSAIVRLTDMGLEPYLLGAALRGVVAQRLLRKVCPKCRRADRLTDAERASLGPRAARLGEVWRAAGCDACLGGYRGRTGVYEMLVVDSAITEAVRRSATATELRRMATERGVRSLADHALDLVASGGTTLDEVFRVFGTDLDRA